MLLARHTRTRTRTTRAQTKSSMPSTKRTSSSWTVLFERSLLKSSQRVRQQKRALQKWMSSASENGTRWRQGRRLRPLLGKDRQAPQPGLQQHQLLLLPHLPLPQRSSRACGKRGGI